MKALLIFWLGMWSLSLFAQTTPLYENNFENAEIGKLPEGFLALDGGFVVKEENGNRFLDLPGSPLDSFAVQSNSPRSRDQASPVPRRGVCA